MKSQTYYYHREIPEDARHLYNGKVQLWVSLKTRDFATAKRLCLTKTLEDDGLIQSVRTGQAVSAPLIVVGERLKHQRFHIPKDSPVYLSLCESIKQATLQALGAPEAQPQATPPDTPLGEPIEPPAADSSYTYLSDLLSPWKKRQKPATTSVLDETE